MITDRITRGFRLATAPARALPDFVIIGAAKCGTTSLFDYLVAHPLVVSGGRKEIHFFDREHNYERGERWYRSWFPRTSTLERVAEGHDVERAICGEATPNYLAHPGAPTRMHAIVPDARLIVLLREPVDRSWSQYRMRRRWNGEQLEFGDAIRAEAERTPGSFAMMGDREQRTTFLRSSYLARSRYAEQLAWWFDVFPREQVLLLRSEDLFADPSATYRRACEFVGLPPMGEPAFEVHNEGSGVRQVDPEVRAWLADYFAEPNAQLAELTDGAITWPAARL